MLADEPLVAIVRGDHRRESAVADLAALVAESAFVEMRAESGLRQQVDATFARAFLRLLDGRAGSY